MCTTAHIYKGSMRIYHAHLVDPLFLDIPLEAIEAVDQAREIADKLGDKRWSARTPQQNMLEQGNHQNHRNRQIEIALKNA